MKNKLIVASLVIAGILMSTLAVYGATDIVRKYIIQSKDTVAVNGNKVVVDMVKDTKLGRNYVQLNDLKPLLGLNYQYSNGTINITKKWQADEIAGITAVKLVNVTKMSGDSYSLMFQSENGTEYITTVNSYNIEALVVKGKIYCMDVIGSGSYFKVLLGNNVTLKVYPKNN